MAALYELTSQMAQLESILDENGGEVTPELEAIWTETRESLISKTDNYNALMRKLSSSSDAIQAEITRLQSLKKSADNALKRVKEHVLNCMESNNIDMLEGKLCKMYIRKSERLAVDEDTILQRYRARVERVQSTLPPYIRLDFKIDKAVIKADAKASNILPNGCIIETNNNLIIK